MNFFIGTTNSDKIREIGGILYSLDYQFKTSEPIDPEETENDFLGNAILKAKAYAKHTGGITISEDSGLIIPALNGLPGPWSARFSDCVIDYDNLKITNHEHSNNSRSVTDHFNNALVLEMMKNIPDDQRQATFKVVLSVANPKGEILFSSSAESHGTISREERGKNGFGYDPIFIGFDCYEKTYAELDSMRKNLRSHRKKVLDDFKQWLEKLDKGKIC